MFLIFGKIVFRRSVDEGRVEVKARSIGILPLMKIKDDTSSYSWLSKKYDLYKNVKDAKENFVGFARSPIY